MRIKLLPQTLDICRLEPEAPLPSWVGPGFFSITRTPDELSIVCENAPLSVQRCERGWRAFKVEGPLDFSLTGILSSIAAPLAAARVSLFAISTFDTDYVLVRDVAAASAALREAGFKLD